MNYTSLLNFFFIERKFLRNSYSIKKLRKDAFYITENIIQKRETRRKDEEKSNSGLDADGVDYCRMW